MCGSGVREAVGGVYGMFSVRSLGWSDWGEDFGDGTLEQQQKRVGFRKAGRRSFLGKQRDFMGIHVTSGNLSIYGMLCEVV